MQLDLPHPISSFFAEHGRRLTGIADLFSKDAVVKDEGHTYRGIPAIEHWINQSSAKYDFTSRPIGCDAVDGVTMVTCRVAGNFPGSPIDLCYGFRIDGNKIANLEIIP